MSCPVTGPDAPSRPPGDPRAGCPAHAAPVVIDPMVGRLAEETSQLRDAGPVTRMDLMGVTAWTVTHHAEARQAVTDTRLVKDINQWRQWQTGEVTRDWPLIGMVETDRSMFNVDGAEHRRLRTKTAQAITPRRLDRLRPDIERITHDLLDRMVTREPGEVVDLKSAFALPLPMKVVSVLMGVDPVLHPRLHELYTSFFSVLTPPDERMAVIAELDTIFSDMVKDKAVAPADDLTSALLQAEAGGEPLSHEEVVGNLKAMVAAGHETTISLIVTAVRALLSRPDQLDLVLNGQVPWETVIEETLRFESPSTHLLMRFATEDLELGGARIAAGDAVVISYRAVGRDTTQHGPNADEFDITRVTPIRHMAFGHGPHICPGAALSRAEAAIALPALFDRFPNIQLAVPADEITNMPVLTQNELRDLPVLLHGT